MIKITPRFTTAQIRKMILERKKRIEEALLLRLQRVGESFIADARQSASFTDDTGNLRSSIGYVILKNGFQLHKGGFYLIKKGGEGIKVTEKLIDEMREQYPTGFVLIGVAGMDYAAAVESKGFDVISTSANRASAALKISMKKLTQNIN